MPKKIQITKNGPYIVSGNLPLAKEIIVSDDSGYPVKYGKGEKYPKQETYALCRCGHSKNKPFCDGTHIKVKFDGTETASKKKFIEQAVKIDGPNLILGDAEDLCSGARFCHGKEGSTWQLTRESDNPKSREIAIKQACNCPSGRLVAFEKKTCKAIEPKLEPSISLLEDPDRNASGPIWAKGNIEIVSSDGKKLEKRNRCTLCRCGHSTNKPFCDSRHISAKFNDGDKSLQN